jgi:hypothetical protein
MPTSVRALIKVRSNLADRQIARIDRPYGVVVSAQHSCRLLNDAPSPPTAQTDAGSRGHQVSVLGG